MSDGIEVEMTIDCSQPLCLPRERKGEPSEREARGGYGGPPSIQVFRLALASSSLAIQRCNW